MRPAAKRFGEWASASRVFSAITHLSLTSLPSFSGKLIIYFFHFLVRACSTSSCLPAEVVVWCNYTFSPSRHHHQTWRWRALAPYGSAASPR